MANSIEIRFKAFLSYSHKDSKWGRWLHKELESYRVDRDLVGKQTPVGKIPPNLRPIFVDRDDFASGSSLKEVTRRAIEASEFLVVICSPHAATSYHVNEEVRLFKAMGRSSHVVPIIVGGEPGALGLECFPPALRFDVGPDGSLTSVPAEPVAADAREIADGRELAKLKVVAGLLGVGLDEIRKRAARTARRRAIALGTTAVVMGLLAITAGGMAWIAHLRKIEAEQRLDWALQTAGSITSKSIAFKNKFGVPAPVLTDLLQEVEQLLGRLADQGVNSRELVAREAILSGALSDGNVSIGNTEKGLENARTAVAKREWLAEASGHSPQYENDLAWSRIKVADILLQQNKTDEAKSEFLVVREIFKSLTTKEPSNLGWQESYSSSLGRLAQLYERFNIDTAKQYLDEEIEIDRKLVLVAPLTSHLKLNLAMALNERAREAAFSKDADQTPFFLEALSIESELARTDPTNIDWAENLAATRQNLGYSYERQGNLAEAIKYYSAARDERQKLSEIDPTNVSKLDKLVSAMGSVAYAYALTAQLGLAEQTFSDIVAARRKIMALDRSDDSQKGRLIISLAQLAKVQFDLGKTSLALSNVEEATSIGSELIRTDPNNSSVKAAVVIDLGMVAMIRNVQGDLKGSTSALERMIALSDELAKDDPNSALKELEVFMARLMLAISYRQEGKLTNSLEVLVALKNAADRHEGTNDVLWLNVLSQLYNQTYLSTINSNVSNASKAADRCLEVSKRWSGIDVQSDLASQALGMAYTIVGESARFLKRLDDARDAVLAGLEIRKRLSEKQGGSAQYAADLAASWSQLNAVLWDKGDYAGALDAEKQALTLRERLVAADPMNFEIRSDLAASYADVSAALEQLDRRDEARKALALALESRQLAAQAQPSRQDFVESLTVTKARLAKLDDLIRNTTPLQSPTATQAEAIRPGNTGGAR
jgi:tetratricopeptide (TPR) repeat protein